MKIFIIFKIIDIKNEIYKFLHNSVYFLFLSIFSVYFIFDLKINIFDNKNNDRIYLIIFI